MIKFIVADIINDALPSENFTIFASMAMYYLETKFLFLCV